jgi:formylglycine-generating enzyme required for sulfatase activity
MNPNVLDASNKRKVVRGGSWKDVAYFLQVSTRDFEYADSARSFIGFRTVQHGIANNRKRKEN